MNLSNNLLKLRKQNQMTQKELADMLQVTFQTISKWENGNAFPDISFLPDLARIFKVSIDQLLGVLPIESNNYTLRNKTDSNYREGNMDQLTADRILYWNKDYLEFLVKHVWQLTQPIKIAEINCGNGYFASQIMPFLNSNSQYFGFDTSNALTENPVEYITEHNNCQLNSIEDISLFSNHFDVVICQGYLRHHSQPLNEIENMKLLLKSNGLLICHEENRPFENAGLLLENLHDTSFEKGILLEKLWQTEYQNEGRDYRIGLRLPILLKKAGLFNIQARNNDRLNIVLSNEDQEILDLINAHFKLTSITEDEFLNFLLERGLNRYEASRYLELYHERVKYMTQDINKIKLIHQIGLIICWGYK